MWINLPAHHVPHLLEARSLARLAAIWPILRVIFAVHGENAVLEVARLLLDVHADDLRAETVHDGDKGGGPLWAVCVLVAEREDKTVY